jgi:drug/metabolite transporter (DMT)-like permease
VTVTLSSLIPVAVVAVVMYLLHRSGMKAWHGAVCVLAGVVLAGSVIGPQLSAILFTLSGRILP